ncbi:MAG: MopE-related protein [Myxococcota bacterium]
MTDIGARRNYSALMMRFGWLLVWVACVTEDFDGDGFIEPEDCNDNDAASFPGAEEIPYDRVDQNCDGVDLTDIDGDGFDSELAGGSDCNDFRFAVNPGVPEIPYDGVDQNCDGWNDFDADFDGFEAQGFGGDDCDDTSAAVVPLDFDGDGFTPCTGDCDDNDPFRSPGIEPVCGNDVEDDCDGVSDCAPTGAVNVVDSPIRIDGPEGVTEFGSGLALPGDVTGDGGDDLAVTAVRADGSGVLWVYEGPLTSEAAVRTTVGVPGESPGVVALGDLDNDGRGEMVVTWTDGAVAHATVVTGDLPEGTSTLDDVSVLEIQTLASNRLDPQIGTLSDGSLVFGTALAANRDGRVFIVPSDPSPNPVTLGDVGATIRGSTYSGLGVMVEALDVNGDGDRDLVIGGLPDGFDRSVVWVVEDPPTFGTHDIDDIASARIELPSPWRVAESATMSDVDADGRIDLVLGIPAYDQRTGAVVAFTSRVRGDLSVEDAAVLIVGLGDQSFGERLATADHDGDGQLDLLVGAPGTFNEGGDGSAAGIVHFFYGPLERDNIVSLEDDWRFESSPVEGIRQRLGFQVGFASLDGDTHIDLIYSAPRLGTGSVFVWPGGSSARNGI